MFSTPRTSIRNHFSAIGRSAAMKNRSVISAVEAVLVDGVVAGDPAAQEGEELGPAAAPTGRRRPRRRRAGTRRASRRRGCRASGWRSRVVAGARSATSRRPARRARLGRGGARRLDVRSAASAARGVGWRPRRAAGPARPVRASAARLAGRGRTAACRCRAGAAAGADRDDLGVTHRSAPSPSGDRLARRAGQPVGDAGEQPLGAAAGGRERRGEVGERLGGGVRRLEAEHARASGWCRRRGRR